VPDLAAAEERWRLTIDNAPVGIALVSLEGKFMRVNEALCRSLGYSTEELLALDFQQLTHPDDLDTDLHFLEQLVAGEIPSYRMRSATWTPRVVTSGPTCRSRSCATATATRSTSSPTWPT
jgi:PAS domain S-box-containing protein